MGKENSDAKELAEAKHEMSCCDDIALDRPLADCISQLQTHREYLETRCGEMRKALEEIAEPIRFMREEAEAQGRKLDGRMAVELSNSANYLKQIARNALNGGPQ